VDHQGRDRDSDHPRADAAVPLWVTRQHPHHEDRRQREVDTDVVTVEEADDGFAVERQRLHRLLGEQAQPALETDHLAGVLDGLVGVVAGQIADLAVADEGDGDDDQFAHQPRTAGRIERGRGVHADIVEPTTDNSLTTR
jgi:hypothetical protein